MRTACLVLLAALSLPAGAVATTFEDYPQTGGSIALVGKDGIRTVSVRMGQDCVGTLRLCIPLTADPRTTGASFELFNTAGHGDDVACADLPKELWSVKPTKFRQTRYRDQSLAASFVQSVATRFGKDHAPELVVRASGKSALHPLTYTLDEPSQGSVAVVLTLPRGRYCVDSGGVQCETDADCLPPTPGSCQDTVLRMCAAFAAPTTDVPGIFRAKAAAPPAACPDPPPCP